ncbi:unnamed protein product [Auanema sp. JU1783]|nr:unnamed protein product [Auanema sp. JU1783]
MFVQTCCYVITSECDIRREKYFFSRVCLKRSQNYLKRGLRLEERNVLQRTKILPTVFNSCFAFLVEHQFIRYEHSSRITNRKLFCFSKFVVKKK